MTPSIYLVDAVGFLFRSYYAITPMTNAEGASTHALYGFIRSIQKLIKDFSPNYLVAVFDGPDNSASRTELYAEYKSHRKEMPSDLGPQIGLAIEFCKLFGISVLQVGGVEADDTIASIAKWIEKKHFKTYICSSDKDLCQLVNEHTFLINTHKDNLLIDKEKVVELFGVAPEQIVDLLALMGDASDNIPGVPGIGPKTAAKLLAEFGTLKNLLSHTSKIDSEKRRELIETHEKEALMSYELALLNLNVEFPHEVSFFELKKPQKSSLVSFYKTMNFKSLLKDIIQHVDVEGDSFKKEEDCHYTAVETIQDLLKLRDKLLSCKEICIDTETTSVQPMLATLVGMGFGVEEKKAFYVPCLGKLSLEEILSVLKDVLEDRSKVFIGHNIKYDAHVLKNHGITLSPHFFDTMIASYLLNSESNRHNLDLLSLEIFDKKKIPIETLIGKGKKQISMADVPLPLITEYCCEDVDYTLRLKHLFEKLLEERGLMKVFKEIEMPLVPVLFSMEEHGMHVDKEKLLSMSLFLNKEIGALEKSIFEECGETFNLNSPKQLGEVLFVKLGISPPAKKSGPPLSTSASVLESLQEKHPVCRKILAYRGLEKLRSTYVESLPEQIHPKTGNIHCTFNQSVAATGRLSCQDPNLQNIPIRTEEGKKIREAFIPSKKGWSFLSADYSQIELRILAHLSQDPTLIKAFKHHEDIHSSTAASVFNVDQNDVTKEMRDMAKAVNFGILYGQQAFGLSLQLGISVQQASKFIHTYFEKYPKVKIFLDSCKEEARKSGLATTFTGRQRPIVDIHSKNPVLKAAAERLAVNTPIQGAQADIIKMAMIKIQEKLTKHPELGFMVLQIHDELLFEAPDEHLSELKKIVVSCMENIVHLCIPLTVDVAVGKNWGEC